MGHSNLSAGEKKVARLVQKIINYGSTLVFGLLVGGLIVALYFANRTSEEWSKPSAVRVTNDQLNALLGDATTTQP